jgi:hypothetical protein
LHSVGQEGGTMVLPTCPGWPPRFRSPGSRAFFSRKRSVLGDIWLFPDHFGVPAWLTSEATFLTAAKAFFFASSFPWILWRSVNPDPRRGGGMAPG